MHLKLIGNPVAGGDARREIARAAQYFSAQGCAVDTALTEGPGDAARLAAAAKAGRFDRIVVLGGDGTLTEAINGLAPAKIPLAYVPLGTTNVFALEAGIPLDLEQACQIALTGVPKQVCLGRIGERRFLLMASIGFDAEVVRRVNLRLKRRIGKLAYLASALQTFCSWQAPQVEIVCEDGSSLQGFGVVISNARLYGGRFSISPEASLHHDRLEVCLFRRGERWQLLRYALKIALGRPLSAAEAVRFQARALTVKTAGAPLQVDGDFWGETPLTIGCRCGEISLVFPQRCCD